MKSTVLAGSCVFLLFLSVGTAFAVDGAIPIWEPTTISEPGQYILTRDVRQIDQPGFGAILISGNDIELNLNGFTVEGHAEPITINGNGVTVCNGSIIGYDEATLIAHGDNFVLRDLKIVGGDDEVVSIGGNNGLIERLVVGPGSGEGFRMYGSGVTIRDNVIRDVGNGISVFSASEGNQIIGNTFTGSWAGIHAAGAFDLFRDNLFVGNLSYGIRLDADSHDNVLRGNTSRNNNGAGCTGTASGSDFCDEGTNNTSHGDNYMPGKM